MSLTRRSLLGAVMSSSVLIARRPALGGEKVLLTEFLTGPESLGDYTEVFARAIDATAAREAGTLVVPPGVYPIHHLVLMSNVVIEGAGRNATVLSALSGADDSLIGLDIGPVQNSGLRNLSLLGGTPVAATNRGQWAMRLTGAPSPKGKPHGGLWWSIFENVAANSFDRGVWFDGGTDNTLLPHQFVSLRDIVIYGNAQGDGPGVKLSGQVNQFAFSQVHIDRFKQSSLVVIQAENGKTSPKIHQFDVVTLQGADQAVTIAGAHNVSFTSCWFEQNRAGILVMKDSFGISVAGCRFANSGLGGAAVKFEVGATGGVTGNVFAGSGTAKSIDAGDQGGVLVSGNSFIWGASP